MKRINKKVILLAVSLVLILSAAIGGTVAYLIDQTGSITNTFTPAKVTPEVKEDFGNNVKNNVQIKNKGDIPAYIRVKIVVTWKDEHGNVYGAAPKVGTDYTWTMPENSKWFLKGGFYYYSEPVAAKGTTEILFTDCKLKDGVKAPEGYNLSVDIHAQAIQAEPTTAVTSAWGVTVGADGTLSAN